MLKEGNILDILEFFDIDYSSGDFEELPDEDVKNIATIEIGASADVTNCTWISVNSHYMISDQHGFIVWTDSPIYYDGAMSELLTEIEEAANKIGEDYESSFNGSGKQAESLSSFPQPPKPDSSKHKFSIGSVLL